MNYRNCKGVWKESKNKRMLLRDGSIRLKSVKFY